MKLNIYMATKTMQLLSSKNKDLNILIVYQVLHLCRKIYSEKHSAYKNSLDLQLLGYKIDSML